MSFRGAIAAVVAMLLAPVAALAQGNVANVNLGTIVGANLRNNADGVLGMLGYSVLPGAAASSLQIIKGSTDNPGLSMGQFGSGFTVDDRFPLYLEGYLGYSRYDPGFVFQDPANRVRFLLPSNWNSVAANGGIGWDFALSDHWVLRPIATVMVGAVASDVTLASSYIAYKTNLSLKFLRNGYLYAAGAGGSLVLAYYIQRDAYDFDLELRSTNNYLTSWGGTSTAVRGQASSIATSIWTRLRWPTGFELFHGPLRYVVQLEQSTFYGDQARSLGFSELNSIGGGLEVDPSAYKLGAMGLYTQRVRIIGSYFFGAHVSGWSTGIGISF